MGRSVRLGARPLAAACILLCWILTERLTAVPAAAAVPATPAANGELMVTALRTEYAENPLGIDAQRPRLSWQIQAQRRAVIQAAYQVRVARSEEALLGGKELAWDSGRVDSDQSIQLPYHGEPLRSRERYYWQVRIWDNGGKESAWSAAAYWEMGLLSGQDWSARWIRSGTEQDPATTEIPPLLRREFTLQGEIERARVYVTSHGLYRLYLNGERVGVDEFTPGFTSYGKRLQYQVYDITGQLREGRNAVGAMLGNGWYRGVLGLESRRNSYGTDIELLAQIEVRYRDGRIQRIVTDGDWRSSTGPLLMSEIYDGETYDARLEKDGWSRPGYDDRTWLPVRSSAATTQILVVSGAPPVRQIEELKPVRIFVTPAGEKVVDLGQNMVGWVRLRVRGPAGTRVTLRHAEVLDGNGNLYTDNLRSARQQVQYILRGGAAEVFEPHFTFQGFRYVGVDGYPGKLTPASITGIVLHSNLSPSGEFSTSQRLVNQLQHNIIWGQKGNFLDVPTDCPQRDERLGWTGDAQVFSATAAFNMDVAAFFAKWLADLAADQYADGGVPFVVPDVIHVFRLSEQHAADFDHRFPDQEAGGTAGWGDAATVIPWNMYLAYADRRILQTQYESMMRWVRFEQARAGDDYIWDGDFQFGDWLDSAGAARKSRFGATAHDLIATAYFAHSTDILQRIALVLGKQADAARYQQLLANIRKAFRAKFVAADGQVGEGTQTAYVLALDFDLLPESLRPLAAGKLAADVRARGHLTTGFLGTPHLLNVLSRFGYLGEAYTLLEREEFPSWLYPVRRGATTVWERWDGLKPDGSFQDSAMNSFNHYAYGSVGEWMYRTMAGIDIDANAPGYKHILIAPRPGGGFTHVSASHDTPYGKVSSAWRIEGTTLNVSVEVPPNTSAAVRLPGARLANAIESGRPLESSPGISDARQDGDAVVLSAGSGRYAFQYAIAGEPHSSGSAR